MKITRYPQSCLALEDGGRKLVIDPGTDFLESHKQSELDGTEAVLYTHQHPDHIDPELAKYLKDQGAVLYGNKATARSFGDKEMQVIETGQDFVAAGFKVTAHDLPHCPMPDGSEGPQNTGYLLNGDVFFHPGDGKEITDLRVDNLALPIQGPDVSFRDANDFARQVKAKTVIPIHYDLMGANPDVYKMFSEGYKMPFEIRVLTDGESAEVGEVV